MQTISFHCLYCQDVIPISPETISQVSENDLALICCVDRAFFNVVQVRFRCKVCSKLNLASINIVTGKYLLEHGILVLTWDRPFEVAEVSPTEITESEIISFTHGLEDEGLWTELETGH